MNVKMHQSKAYGYKAIFLEDNLILDSILDDDHEKLSSKVASTLEEKYPNALCQIIDIKNKKIIGEFKRRHYLE